MCKITSERILSATSLPCRRVHRLRGLHQLGLCHFLYPSASHTRFEHSLGVGHEAFSVADLIFCTQSASGPFVSAAVPPVAGTNKQALDKSRGLQAHEGS